VPDLRDAALAELKQMVADLQKTVSRTRAKLDAAEAELALCQALYHAARTVRAQLEAK